MDRADAVLPICNLPDVGAPAVPGPPEQPKERATAFNPHATLATSDGRLAYRKLVDWLARHPDVDEISIIDLAAALSEVPPMDLIFALGSLTGDGVLRQRRRLVTPDGQVRVFDSLQDVPRELCEQRGSDVIPVYVRGAPR